MFEPDRSRPRNSEQASHLRLIAAEPSVSPQQTGLVDAENEAAFCIAWLSSQCTLISGVIAGLLMVPPPAKGLSVASTSWPKGNPYLEDLSRLAERASLERRAIVSPGQKVSDTCPAQPVGLFVALPLGVRKPAHRRCCCRSGIGQPRRAGSRKGCPTAAMGCRMARNPALGPALQRAFNRDSSSRIVFGSPCCNRGASPITGDGDRRRQRSRCTTSLRPCIGGRHQAQRQHSPARDFPLRRLQGSRPPG